MKKKALLIQFRHDVSARHEAECFFEKTGLGEVGFDVLNSIDDFIPENASELLSNYFGLFLGGSGQYDLTKRPEPLMCGIEKTRHILQYVFENDFPTFGVCMGLQVMAYVLGGSVEADPLRSENGSTKVTIAPGFLEDPLFEDYPESFLATEAHKDSIVVAPAASDFKIIMSSEACPIQGFKFKQNIYAVQFHPELGAKDVEYRWTLYPEYLASKSPVQIEEMRAALRDTPEASKLLRNFSKIYQ